MKSQEETETKKAYRTRSLKDEYHPRGEEKAQKTEMYSICKNVISAMQQRRFRSGVNSKTRHITLYRLGCARKLLLG